MNKLVEIGNFIFEPTLLPDVTLIKPKVRGDERGFFKETYQRKTFDEAGITTEFVQDNHSSSAIGTIRGAHLQYPSYQQKLVRAIGRVFDFAVQVYPENSPDFGKWVGVELSSDNHHQLHVGQGRYQAEPVLYAHGFLALTQGAELIYKASDYYNPPSELGLNPFCSRTNIQYPCDVTLEGLLNDNLINARDSQWPGLLDLAEQIWTRIPEKRFISTS